MHRAPIDSGYLQSLRRKAAEYRAEAEARRPPPLAEQVRRWWEELPANQRKDAYTLEEVRQLFRVSPGRLGVALHECGFQRLRRWVGSGPYRRFWIPPATR